MIRVFAVVDEAHKLSYDETLTELIREARKYSVGILLASQSVKDFDRIVFDIDLGTTDERYQLAIHFPVCDVRMGDLPMIKYMPGNGPVFPGDC